MPRWGLPPEIYIEKPIYLQSQIESWNDLLAEHRGLEDRAFYIDHYRFKEPLAWLQAHWSEVFGATGTIREIGFVSLEEQEFWDSQAFDQGYFLEHGCHLVGMLDRVFPGLEEREWSADPTREWKVWEQEGRPPSLTTPLSLSYIRRGRQRLSRFGADGPHGPWAREWSTPKCST